MLKLEKGCEFIPIQYATAHDTKAAFKKFLRVAAPSSLPSDEAIGSQMKLLDDTGWMELVHLMMICFVETLSCLLSRSVRLCALPGRWWI